MSVPPWKVGADAYLPTLAAIEEARQIPTDLLARVAFQECSWRWPVINYEVTSRPGAMGMFQLMPADFPQVLQKRGWQADAEDAAGELLRLYNYWNDWQLAIASYNWGQGNVRKYEQGTANMPLETSNYVKAVFTDVPVAGSLVDT
jgi:membrane-bound lytic murein transglycosylase D